MTRAGPPEVLVDTLDRGVLDPDDGSRGIDVAMVPWFADERPLQGLAALIDWRWGGALSGHVRTQFCNGELGEAVLFPGGARLPFERVVLVGLGASASFEAEQAELAAQRMVQIAHDLCAHRLLLAMPQWSIGRSTLEHLFTSICHRLGELPPRDGYELGPGVGDPSPDERESSPKLASPPPDPGPTREAPRWWVLTQARYVARLRRILEGPLRAAADTADP